MGVLSLPARIATVLPRWITRQILLMIAGVLAVIVLVLYVATAALGVKIEGESMEPTLRDGDRVMLRPFSGGDSPNRFDLVVGRFEPTGPKVVKRVIALPADRVAISTPRGSDPVVRVQPGGTGAWFTVTNPAWQDQWGAGIVRCCRRDGTSAPGGKARLVPAGMLFLLGDNPITSRDTRAFGWAPIELIDGVVAWRVRPLTKIGGVGGELALTPVVDKSAPRRSR
ncbi:MAG: signal peptidase I [Sporichthyaceae bacterium]